MVMSTVVDASVQGQGLGPRLTEAAVELARTRHVLTVFLLTTTADRFFLRFGFERISRDDVSLSVQSTFS